MREFGDTFFYPENFAARDPINLLNLNIGLINSENGWELSAWAKNLTDENYAAEVVQSPGVMFYAKPLQYGLNITKRFEEYLC